MNQELIIVGIGSPFGPDRLGWQVIELLGSAEYAQRLNNAQVQLQSSDRPGTSLLHTLQQFPKAILVDAILADQPAGTIIVTDANTLANNGEQFSSHGFGVAETLQLGQVLEWLPSRLVIVGIVVECNVEQASDAQLQALAQAVYQQACKLLEE